MHGASGHPPRQNPRDGAPSHDFHGESVLAGPCEVPPPLAISLLPSSCPLVGFQTRNPPDTSKEWSSHDGRQSHRAPEGRCRAWKVRRVAPQAGPVWNGLLGKAKRFSLALLYSCWRHPICPLPLNVLLTTHCSCLNPEGCHILVLLFSLPTCLDPFSHIWRTPKHHSKPTQKPPPPETLSQTVPVGNQ